MIAEGSGPAVLLLHGSGPGTTAAAWRPLIDAFAGRFRVLAPDLPGFGSAPAAPIASWLDVIGALLGDDEPCAVVGNSAGGALAVALARAYPRVVTKVVGVGSMGYPMALPAGLDALWGFGPDEESARRLLELLFFDGAAVTPSAVDARLEAMRAQPDYRSLFPAPRQRWVDALSLRREELAAIDVPVLLIQGADDQIVPLADSALPLLHTLPNVRAHIFGRCGHASPVEYTDEFHRLVLTFLETEK
jgi:pimeloyl-ACP methyl ester carboxylesterase